MRAKRTVGIVGTLCALLAAMPVHAQTALEGRWAGNASQTEGGSSYSIQVNFTSSNEAEIQYPEIDCAGNWKRIATAGHYAVFIETITRGSCPDNIAIVASLGDALAYGALGTNRDQWVVAWALLKRQR